MYVVRMHLLIKFNTDRKKDLVKLQRGEYLSMGKIESIFKTFHYIENICVYGDPSKDVCVALVTPIQKQVRC